MKSMLRLICMWAALAVLPGLALGCYVKAETMTSYTGSDVVQTATYSSGQHIRVESFNGKVTMRPGSATDTITVTFKPFTMRPDEDKEKARTEMQEDLVYTVDDSGSTILIKAARTSGWDFLGADIRVELPSGFDGGIEIDQNNGFVDADLQGGLPAYTTVFGGNGGLEIWGAAGPLDIFSDNGSVDMSVQAWSTADGSVVIDGPGDLSFQVAAGLSGRITAQAGGADDADNAQVIGPSGGDWTETETAPNNKSYEFGTDPASGGLVTLSTSFFTSTITITQ